MALDEALNDPSYSASERRVAAALIREHYAALLKTARWKRRRARLGDSLATVDLLHESFLKLRLRGDWVSDEHFVRAVMLAMRHVIIDHARRRQTEKRGGGAQAVPLEVAEPFLPEFSETPEDVVAIAELLQKLGAVSPRWLQVVDARYFSGLTEEEAAVALGVSVRTVRRDWAAARAWIAERMGVERV